MELKLKRIELKRNDKGVMKVCGSYAVYLGGTEIASKGFNDGYGEHEFNFSSDVMGKLGAIESAVEKEIMVLLGINKGETV
jgi:hypothetical protein